MRNYGCHAVPWIAAGILACGAISLAAAETRTLDVSASARGFSTPSPAHASTSSDTASGGLAETTVTVGLETPGLPCANCVGGAGEPNIGLPWPVFAVTQGQTMTVSTWFEATTYTGPCAASVVLKQGGTVVATGSYPVPGGCKAGQLYGVFFTVPVPTTTGLTTVIGQVAGAGTSKSGTATFINVQ